MSGNMGSNKVTAAEGDFKAIMDDKITDIQIVSNNENSNNNSDFNQDNENFDGGNDRFFNEGSNFDNGGNTRDSSGFGRRPRR